MKKNRIFWSMLTIMMVTMLSVGIAACGDDDKDDNESSNGIVGTWSGSDDGDVFTLVFNSNGTGTYTLKEQSSYSYSGSGSYTEKGTFTYTMDGQSKGIIIIKTYDSYSGSEKLVFYFVIDGKNMSLYEDGYYDDLAFVLTKQGDNGNESSGSNSSVVGTWSGSDDGDVFTLVFNSNGTGTYTLKEQSSYSYSGSGSYTEKGTFTYTMDGQSKGIIIIKTYDSYSGSETAVFYFVIDGKTMVLYEDGYYDDLEWVLFKQ